MAYISPTPRIRGLYVLVGGTSLAILLSVLTFATGAVDLGFGAPEVRIDSSRASAWPIYPD